MGPTSRLAQYTANLTFNQLPRELVELIKQCILDTLGVAIASQTRILAGAGHVDGKAREPHSEQNIAIAAAVFFPTVDAAPVHDDGRTIASLGNL